MTPESPRARVYVRYTLLENERRNYLLVAEPPDKDPFRAVGRDALCSTMLDDLVTMIKELGPTTKVLVATAKGDATISQQTIEHLYTGKLSAADLLI